MVDRGMNDVHASGHQVEMPQKGPGGNSYRIYAQEVFGVKSSICLSKNWTETKSKRMKM